MATDPCPINEVPKLPSEPQSEAPPADDHRYAPDPTLIYDRSSIPDLWLREFKLWFVNRREFYLQHAYATPADYDPKKKVPAYVRMKNSTLNEEHIARHLCGIHTAGLYNIDPDSNTCKWFCLDADYKDEETREDTALRDLIAIEEEMRLDGLSPALEYSRRGGHLWLLCEEPLPAKDGRIYLYNLMDRLGYRIRGARGNKEGVEIFPKQETLEEGQYGNGVRAPLGIHRKDKKRYWFSGAAPDLASQFRYLRALPRLTRSKLESLIDGYSMPDDLVEKPYTPPPVIEDPASKFNQFDISRYVRLPRNIPKGGAKVRCPSCAKGGRDTSGDNLNVSLKAGRLTPAFYCHAGCTFRDILDACGFRYERPEPTFQRKFK